MAIPGDPVPHMMVDGVEVPITPEMQAGLATAAPLPIPLDPVDRTFTPDPLQVALTEEE